MKKGPRGSIHDEREGHADYKNQEKFREAGTCCLGVRQLISEDSRNTESGTELCRDPVTKASEREHPSGMLRTPSCDQETSARITRRHSSGSEILDV